MPDVVCTRPLLDALPVTRVSLRRVRGPGREPWSPGRGRVCAARRALRQSWGQRGKPAGQKQGAQEPGPRA